jgi:GNAT superfamily N-acetyltransferase
MTNVGRLLWLVRAGEWEVGRALARRWWNSEAVGMGLQRGLDTPVASRRPRQRLTIRPIRPAEHPWFADPTAGRGEGALLRINARHLFSTQIETCYVALTEQGVPCYMQYLILPDQNDRLADAFGGMIPPLEAGDALLEFAFTLEGYRALGVMPWAVAQLAEEARRHGARRLVTWVPGANVNVRRYFERAGFTLLGARHERYRHFRRTVRFEPIGVAGAPGGAAGARSERAIWTIG